MHWTNSCFIKLCELILNYCNISYKSRDDKPMYIIKIKLNYIQNKNHHKLSTQYDLFFVKIK